MECKSYFSKKTNFITLLYNNTRVKKIEYIHKTFSSLMGSYVIFCYPVLEDGQTNDEQAFRTINLYHDDEYTLDQIIQEAVNTGYINLGRYYESESVNKMM